MIKQRHASRLNEELSDSSQELIGDYIPLVKCFDSLPEVLKRFRTKSFQTLSRRKQFKLISQALLELIQKSNSESFLLDAVTDYINQINQGSFLPGIYSFNAFEFWLNHFSGVSPEENYLVRAKIMGKLLPREAYQIFFPLGNSHISTGTHFVTAHLSPDMDTTIASFWGWVDAFAARVGSRQHIWCLPGGAPPSPMMRIFYDLFGEGIIESAARTALTLSLTAQDLVTQKNVYRVLGNVSINDLDHGTNEKAIILVDEKGHYKGDWRSSDVEPVRQVTSLFKACLHWFENNLHIKLISLFSSASLTVDQVQSFTDSICDVAFYHCESVLELTESQKQLLDCFLQKVLKVPNGLQGTFRDLAHALTLFEIHELTLFMQELHNLTYSSLFDVQGQLIDHRTSILNTIERLIIQLDIAIHALRTQVERLDMAVLIKEKVVLTSAEPYIVLYSDVNEIRLKMQSYNYLVVLLQDAEKTMYPVGVIWADELRKNILGTVSFRDFSSLDEVRMESYLSVISVIDHHRSTLSTVSTPSIVIGDAQATNVLLAEMLCSLNERYSVGGISLEKIQSQLQELASSPLTPVTIRLQNELLKKLTVYQQPSSFFVHPKREFAEYLTCLHGICDDTDLLTKVTARDVICVARLLNQMKSLIQEKQVEIISLDDIPLTADFAKQAAKRILHHPDMYSIYSKMFSHKEEEVKKQLLLCREGEHSDIFADTKVQNGCCRVGQIKLFSSNIPTFTKCRLAIIQKWIQDSEDSVNAHPEIDFHLMMMSTVPSADEVYEDRVGHYSHQDELWLWGPNTEQAFAHLSSFLLSFQNVLKPQMNSVSIEIPRKGAASGNVEDIFRRHFLPSKFVHKPSKESSYLWAVVRYQAATINSRKAMITPYLPRLLN